ncbi:MAG: Secretion system C-terminal sorting domain, partial [Bacteroidota bacterium]
TLAGNYFIKNNQAGCNAVSSNSYYFVVTDIVNLEDNQFVKVTPNPYSSNIYLHFYLKGYNSLSVDVVDFATGRPIANRVKQPTGSNLNLQSLSAGVYVIKVYSSDMKFVHMFKIVKL